MQPGRFDQRVAIDEPIFSPDSSGGRTRSFSEVAEVWAAVWPIGAREQFTAAQPEGVESYRVTIRRFSGLTVQHRLRWVSNQDKVMNVRGIIDNGPRATNVELLVDVGIIGNG